MRNLGGGEFSFKVAPLSATTVFTFRGGDDQDGLPTLRLVRWSIGAWTLTGIAPGQWTDGDPNLLPK